MSIPWADPGGEYYFSLGGSGALSAGLWAQIGPSALKNNVPIGRATQYGILEDGGSNILSRNLGANYTSFIVGFALNIPSNNFANNNIIVQFKDAASSQVELRCNAAGNLYFTRNNTVIGSTSTQALNAGWHYFEVKVTINSTTGSAEVKVDSVTWVTDTGVNTQNTANAFMQTITWQGIVNTGNVFIKDIVFIDTTTGVNTNYLGDINVGVYFINGSGANTQWTPNPGANQNYQNVQDGITHTGTWPDGDTTYNSSSTAGQLDDYAHQPLTLTGTIYAVVHVSYLRKDDAGARTVDQYIKSGATISLSPDISLGNSYLYYFQTAEQDPNTSAAWTVTGYNNMTCGCKLVS